MRELTEAGQTFSFSFHSCNLSDKKSRGKIFVQKAKIRKQNADMMFQYFDEVQQKSKQCYVCLLMTFNNQKIEL
ncbi:hypothetical protein [Aureivirga marina]|uniref:hypothetical protein n=1 Tax=Aureivirga marina TaxID=1182451 RepID=UPI0018CA7FDF|nr:hypothetical protein [Aureivirga marina]